MSQALRPAVFLDRDGNLNRERSFVTRVEDIEVLPGVTAALRQLATAGYALVVVTNQSGIARGLYSESDLAGIHATLHARIDRLPDAYFHCPHHPEQSGPYGRVCTCRKPATGLIESAAELLHLDLARSFVVGDSARDVLAGATLPLRSVLVRSGKPWEAQLAACRDAGYAPDHVAEDLAAAAAWILDQAAPNQSEPARLSPDQA